MSRMEANVALLDKIQSEIDRIRENFARDSLGINYDATPSALLSRPFCLLEEINLSPYKELMGGLCFGFEDRVENKISIRQVPKKDNLGIWDAQPFDFEIVVHDGFDSDWLTLEVELPFLRERKISLLSLHGRITVPTSLSLVATIRFANRKGSYFDLKVGGCTVEPGTRHFAMKGVIEPGRAVSELKDISSSKLLIFFPPNAGMRLSLHHFSMIVADRGDD